ncbi:DEAD/DEAH box helicase [Deinococcus sedimenti]|uniref:DEAD/DEAH box helicase n=1 Tax=Deinococcus sedimenti TaxID=1867090 RepID=A0ABQ2S075_9DEIO|nr:DEAD/DEAH box helicase [Deinococcus sedimenti]GGR84343.1 hypothetical protein GCM10008960_09210 [Deinococcus sedimenti]
MQTQTQATNMNDILSLMADIGLIDAPVTDPTEAQQAFKAALASARAAEQTVVGARYPQVLHSQLFEWAQRRGWTNEIRAADGVGYVMPDRADQARSWVTHGSVRLLIATPRIEETTVISRPTGAPTLRPYQVDAISQTEAHWEAGRSRVLVRLPTGTGKSVVIAEIARRHVEAGGVVVAMAHTLELISQLAEHIGRGVDPELIGQLMSKHRPEPHNRVIVSTVQSAGHLGHYLDQSDLDNILCIVDEAHRIVSNKYRKSIKSLAPRRVLGVTATPVRTDGRGLGGDFDVMVQTLSYAQAFAGGYLIKPTYYVPSEFDLQALRTTAGDYDLEDAAKEAEKPQVVGSLIDTINRIASDRQIIIFNCTRKHSQAVLERLKLSGYTASAHIDGDTNLDERKQIMADFKSGEIQILCNVDVCTEGVDVPDVGAVFIMRPTKSVSRWLQIAGRALRTAPGKSDCLIVDHTGSMYELGPVENYETWELEMDKTNGKTRKSKVGKSDTERTCTCGNAWKGGPRCPACGAVASSKNWEAENQAALDADLIEWERRQEEALTPAQRERREKKAAKAARDALKADKERLYVLYRQMQQYAATQTRSGKPGQAFFWFVKEFGFNPPYNLRDRPLPFDEETGLQIQEIVNRQWRQKYAAEKNAKAQARAQARAETEAQSPSQPEPVSAEEAPEKTSWHQPVLFGAEAAELNTKG